jgi:hypothetical protein
MKRKVNGSRRHSKTGLARLKHSTTFSKPGGRQQTLS